MKNMLGLAIHIAAEAFKDKTDKSGEPYILHCLRVMNSQTTLRRKIIAVLHDVPEDTEITEDMLAQMGFEPEIIMSLRLLNHSHGTPYMLYIKGISTNEDATAVKLADLEDNSRITRLKGLTKADFDRMEKYHTAYIYLSKT